MERKHLRLVASNKEPEKKLPFSSGGMAQTEHNGVFLRVEHQFNRDRVNDHQQMLIQRAVMDFFRDVQKIFPHSAHTD